MIDQAFVDMLRCPQDQTPLHLAQGPLLDRLNQAIGNGRVKNQAGRLVNDLLQGGLVRQDGRLLYPINDDIPVLLAEEAISLEPIEKT